MSVCRYLIAGGVLDLGRALRHRRVTLLIHRQLQHTHKHRIEVKELEARFSYTSPVVEAEMEQTPEERRDGDLLCSMREGRTEW